MDQGVSQGAEEEEEEEEEEGEDGVVTTPLGGPDLGTGMPQPVPDIRVLGKLGPEGRRLSASRLPCCVQLSGFALPPASPEVAAVGDVHLQLLDSAVDKLPFGKPPVSENCRRTWTRQK
ncbi:unnamed protein product [Prorocentrum cordatum]|uniref:Uncharacterized protein n=1 Tax=Prorocentrum cordatum TaxID=2364126 RepID=A0ABN9T4X2_9DINO|nr:unnamed protein product [Polarella glacialis]